MCFGESAESKAAKAAARDEKKRQKAVTRGIADIDSSFGQFDERYFGKRREEFFNANLPALMAAFRGGRDNTMFSQARRGMIGPGGATSSAAIGQNRNLFAGLNADRQSLMERGFDFTDAERSRLLGSRQNMVGELRASYDPGASMAAMGIQKNTPAGGSGVPGLFANLSGIAADVIRPPKRAAVPAGA